MSVFGKSLTRQEWNAAYFLGLEEVVTGRFRGPFDAQVRRGIEILADNGYALEVQVLLEQGGRLRDWSVLPDEHERACREIARGDFDTLERAREALRWLDDAAPETDGTWIQGMLEVRAHAVRSPPAGPTRDCERRMMA